jgi:hypothetical protein
MSFIAFLLFSVSFQFSLCLSIRKQILSQFQSKMNAFDSFENVFITILNNSWTTWKSCLTSWIICESRFTSRHSLFSIFLFKFFFSSRSWILRWLFWCSCFWSRNSSHDRKSFRTSRNMMKTNLNWMFENKVSFSECTLTTIATRSNNSKSHTRKIDSLSRKKFTISWILIELTIFAL